MEAMTNDRGMDDAGRNRQVLCHGDSQQEGVG